MTRSIGSGLAKSCLVSTPIDVSVLYTRRPDVLKQAFSLVPEYLRTPEDDVAPNLMDYGVSLGRRFRALKLWMVLTIFQATKHSGLPITMTASEFAFRWSGKSTMSLSSDLRLAS